MNNSEIQIQFPRPGEWQEFTLTAIYRDYDGYMHADRYTADEIPTDHAPAMQAVVAALVGLGEDWQAVQVWARLNESLIDAQPSVAETVNLTVEAVNPQGGRRMFTARDYPAFILTDLAAVAFFNFFTTPTNNNIIK